MISGVHECGLAIVVVVVYLRIYSIQENLDDLVVFAFVLCQLWRLVRFCYQRKQDNEEIVDSRPTIIDDIVEETKIQRAIREVREEQAKRVFKRISSMNITNV